MSKMIQIRDVPDELHRRLKARAAEAGQSLSDYLKGEIERSARRPTPAELWSRMQQRSRVVPRVSPARAVRQEREAR